MMSITIYPRNKEAGFDKDLFEIKNDSFHLLQT